MWENIVKIFMSLFDLWSKLSEETKSNIINSIVEAFSDIFRKQYRDAQDGEPA